MSRWHNGRRVPDVEWSETLPKRIRALGARAYARHFLLLWLGWLTFFALVPLVPTSLACDVVRDPALYSFRLVTGSLIFGTAIALINELLPNTVSVNEGILNLHMPGERHAPVEIHAVHAHPLTRRVTRLTFLTSAGPHPIIVGASPDTAAAVLAALPDRAQSTLPLTPPPPAPSTPAQTPHHARPASESQTPSPHTAACTARNR